MKDQAMPESPEQTPQADGSSLESTMDTVRERAFEQVAPGKVGHACWHQDDDGVGILRLGPVEEADSTVTLTHERMDAFGRCLDEIEKAATSGTLKGLIITGPGPKMFAAGADIHAIGALKDAQAGEAEARRGQQLYERIERLPVPSVAAIGGPCVGGGYELALACTRRVAADSSVTKIGLPEVKLGILPGFGGSQRLPRLVGLPKALDLILQGKIVDAQRARKSGMVDRAVPPERLMEAARQELDKLLAMPPRKRGRRTLRGFAWWASKFPPLRNFVASKVRKTLSQGPARFYPAPRRALECCVAAFSESRARGFELEARGCGELVETVESKSLVRLFFLTEASKRTGKAAGAKKVERAVVVGGGVMGAGIAGLFASRGVATRLCDVVAANLAGAKARLQKTVDKLLKRRRIQKHEAMAMQDHLAVSSELGDLRRTDLWIEAVPEVMTLKQKIANAAVEAGLPHDAVIATNTSSLSIDGIAGDLPNPGRVVGIHFFNPPEKMPLVEVVRGARTSDAAVATACRLALGLGKFPVVVRDGAGFLVNRCLAPYLDEAARLMLEGCEPETVDQVALDFGFPMGPARLLDEIGLDVAAKVAEVLGAAFEHMKPVDLSQRMVQAGHLGAKSGGCFYGGYGKKKDAGKEPGPGRAVLAELRAKAGVPADKPAPSRTEIHDRLVLPMVAEAWRCLEEGIVQSEDDIDLGLVFGIGFPPFLGGLTVWARREGLDNLRRRMEALQKVHGDRFAPPAGLKD